MKGQEANMNWREHEHEKFCGNESMEFIKLNSNMGQWTVVVTCRMCKYPEVFNGESVQIFGNEEFA